MYNALNMKASIVLFLFFFSSREVIMDICIGFVHHLFDSLPSCVFFDRIGFVCCTYYIFY